MKIPELIILGTLFVIMGIILRKFPPKKMNSFYGYRTPSSMKNEETWKFAQKYAANEAIKSGCIMIVIGILINFLNINSQHKTAALISSLFFFSAFIIIRVEMALKKNKKPII